MSRRRSKAELAIELATSHCELFQCSETGEAWADIYLDSHRQVWPVRSSGFRDWLQAAFYQAYEQPLGGQALADTIQTLCARARFEGEERRVALRVAQCDGGVWIDRCDADWTAIRVTAERVAVVPRPDLRFSRAATSQPLPSFDPNGSIDELRPFVNVEDERDFQLVVAFLLAALSGRPPFPILVLQGEQGSGKSTLTRLMRDLVDPSSYMLRSPPREERDLVALARHNWILPLDNVSHIPEWLSDALCRVATGGGIGGRRLYTDDDEYVLNATRPVILNGIPDLIYRPDLSSRSLVVRLRPLARGRRTDRDYWAAFDYAKSRIFGALLRGVSSALRHRDLVQLDELPRLADFAIFVTAAEPGLGWRSGTFAEALASYSRDALTDELAADPVCGAVQQLVSGRPLWTGNVTALLEALEHFASPGVLRSKAWPNTPAALGNRLRRIAPTLRKIGIDIQFQRSSAERTIAIHHSPANAGPDDCHRRHPVIEVGPADGDDNDDGDPRSRSHG